MIAITRRALLGTALAGPVAACATIRDRPSRAASSNAKPLVINGNLVVPIDPETALDRSTADLVRASGLTAVKLTIGGSGQEGRAETIESIKAVDQAVILNPDLYGKVRRVADLHECQVSGKLGLIYSFEASEMLEGDLAAIDQFRRLDILVMGLSYNRTTPFASGTMSSPSTGLTPLGREAVARMNAAGVSVDLSHSDENSSLAAIAASRAPVLITHAGCAAIQPHPRNKSDRLLRALAERGGVVGIYELSYLAAPPRQPGMGDYFAHLVHALKICGEDHVGIGSDATLTPFDTSPESLAGWAALIEARKAAGVAAPGEGPPPFVLGLNRPDRTTVLADGLRARGYPAGIVDKVLGRNLERVFAETWAV